MSGEIDGLLEQSFRDFKLSRGEKQALQAALRDGKTDARTLGAIRASAFRIAREHAGGANGASALAWLEEVCQTLISQAVGDGDKAKEGAASEVCFTPGFDAPARIAGLFRKAAKK